MVFQCGNRGQLLLHGARPTASSGRRPEAEEPHAGLSLTLKLPVQVFPLAPAARRREAGLIEVVEHGQTAGTDHVHRQVGPRPVRGVKKFCGVPDRSASSDANDAGRPPAGGAHDPRLIHFVEPDGLDRFAVDEGLCAAGLKKHGIVGGVLVQLVAREQLLVVRELVGRPPAEIEHPLAGPAGLCLGADHLERLLARIDAIQAKFERPVRALLLEVRVVVDHPGNNGPAP